MKHSSRNGKNAALFQEQVANATNISTRYYRKIEAGECKPNVDTAISIADLLGYDVTDLFGPQRQLRENNTQPDCSISRKGGIAEAKALNKAAKKFNITDVALDVADNGRIDDPVNRKNAQEYYDVLGAALV